MKKRAGRNYTQEEEQIKPDCCICIHRNDCAKYAENSFCTGWQGREPEKDGPDPNDLWRKGEEVEF